MIILDIETTGIDPKKHCMLSLGAVDFQTGKEFYGECSIYPESETQAIALSINGIDPFAFQWTLKQPAHHLYLSFVEWAGQFEDKLLAGHNIGHFDILFLEHYHNTFCPLHKWLFGHRTLDLHSLAFARFRRSLSHKNICWELGLPVEPKPHHALEGARSECAAFKLLLG